MSPPFYTRYGFSRTGDTQAPLVIEPYPEVCVGGALRATVVASAIDLVGGFFTREIAGTDATFTSDLSLRIPAPGIPDRLLAQGGLLRTGRRLVSSEVTLEHTGPNTDPNPNPVYAYGQTTFTRIPRPAGEARDLAGLATPLVIERHPLRRPLEEEVGIESSAATPGNARLPFRSALLNPEGILQGALVALIVECASLSLANATLEAGQVICALDLRYLAAASTGPVEGEARWIGSPNARMIAVELRDRGHEDRLTSTALVRVIDAPDPLSVSLSASLSASL